MSRDLDHPAALRHVQMQSDVCIALPFKRPGDSYSEMNLCDVVRREVHLNAGDVLNGVTVQFDGGGSVRPWCADLDLTHDSLRYAALLVS